MEYFVIGPDGQQYGPATIETLRKWVSEGRLMPTSTLKNFSTGQTLRASDLPELFPPAEPAPSAPPQQMAPPTQNSAQWTAPPAASPYARHGYNSYQPAPNVRGSSSDLASTIFSCALGLVLFFFLRGIGLICTGAAIFRSVQYMSIGTRNAKACLAISIASFAIIGVGWLLRANGTF